MTAPVHSSSVTTLATSEASESTTTKFSVNSFWFIFPLKYQAEYKLSYYYVQRTKSTNDLAFTLPVPDNKEIQIVAADEQTAGRGQGSNTWESEAGKDLSFSLVCRAEFLAPNRQFALLQAAALAVRHVMGKLCDGVTIKWPNDIYIGDKKASGTLIQCDIENNSIRRVVIGIGINVNQEVFHSDAPNPVSLCTIIGRELDRMRLLHAIAERFAKEYEELRYGAYYIKSRYISHLYRGSGFHEYKDNNEIFLAEISDVLDDGHLLLRDKKGRIRSYAFKEVEFII